MGAYTASASPYGAFDMGGDVWQWNEALIGSIRGLRGGSWGNDSYSLASSSRDIYLFTNEDAFLGFRVAVIPEPSTAVLVGIAAVLWMIAWSQRRIAAI